MKGQRLAGLRFLRLFAGIRFVIFQTDQVPVSSGGLLVSFISILMTG
jgi:hypothetical protein